MTNVIKDGIDQVRAAGEQVGHKVQDGVGKVQDGVGAVRERGGKTKRSRSVRPVRVVELIASVTGALAAFFVGKLVRSRYDRHDG